jgi:hypothetical protein
MTRTTAPEYDAAAADLVVRTLRAVAEATPADRLGVTDDPPIVLVPAPDIGTSIRRRRRVRRLVGVTAAAAAALVATAIWTREGGQVEMAPSDEPPPDAAPHPLADKQEVARGETDGTVWRLEVQPVEGGIYREDGTYICVLLNGHGGCSDVPNAFGWVAQYPVSIEGSVFVYGAVAPGAAEVRVELADGDALRVDTTPPAFGFRYYVVPTPPGPDPVAVTAHDEAGVELERVPLGPVELPD